MGCCYGDKNEQQKYQLPLQQKTHKNKVSLAHNNHNNKSTKEISMGKIQFQKQGQQKYVKYGQESKQFDLENYQAEIQENLDGDLPKGVHNNEIHINVQYFNRRKMQNDAKNTHEKAQIQQIQSNSSQYLNSINRKIPVLPLGTLSIIEQESSANDTNRKSAHQMSISGYSQRDPRRLF